MKTRLQAAAAALGLVLAFLSVGMGTYAYFTDVFTVHNVITTGNVDIELIDRTLTADGEETTFPDPADENGVADIMPTETVSKLVRVANTGENEAWVRIALDIVITAENGGRLTNELSGGTPAVAINFGQNTGWVSGEDGCWYYSTPLQPGESTPNLFETVTLTREIGNEYQNCTVEINVQAHAVQVANNSTSVTEAKGWPDARFSK